MPERNKWTEILVIISITAINGASLVFGSVYGGLALKGIYGYDYEMFSVITKLAIYAYVWVPILYFLLITLLAISWKFRPQWSWASWLVLSMVAICSSVVLNGITKPFATTTFKIGLNTPPSSAYPPHHYILASK